MNRLERYALRRIEQLTEIMKKQRNGLSDECQQENRDMIKVRDCNMAYNEASDELKLIVSCLLETHAADLPF